MVESNKTMFHADADDFQPRSVPLSDLDMPLPGQIHLWFLDLGGLAGALGDALGGGGNQKVPDSVVPMRFARRFYLRLLLGAYLGLPGKSVIINRQNRGKPVLDTSIHHDPLHFSMAKSEDKLLIGLSASSQIGVDLEPASRCARNTLGVARRYFSPAEAGSLAATPVSDLGAAFIRVWACKEAVVKASGEGIANQFCRFSVETDLSRSAAVLEFEGDDPDNWSLAMVETGGDFLGAVAIKDRVNGFQAFRLLPAQHPIH